MKKQIHKRLPKDFVEDVIRTFSEEKISREQACELLGLSKQRQFSSTVDLASSEMPSRPNITRIDSVPKELRFSRSLFPQKICKASPATFSRM